jgi:hypothetical protein
MFGQIFQNLIKNTLKNSLKKPNLPDKSALVIGNIKNELASSLLCTRITNHKYRIYIRN